MSRTGVAILGFWGVSLALSFYLGLRGGRAGAEAPARAQENHTGGAAATLTQASTATARSDATASDSLASILAEPDATERRLRLKRLAGQDTGTLVSLAAAARALPRTPRTMEALGLIYQQWGKQDPAAALASLQGLPLNDRARAEEAILVGWATRAPHETWRWLGDAYAADLTNWSLRAKAIVTALLAEDRGAEVASLFALPPGRFMRDGTGALYADYLARVDIKDAVAWVHTLEPGPVREAFLSEISNGVIELGADLGVEFALALPEPRERQRVLTATFRRWATTGDFASAPARIELLGRGAEADAALLGFIPEVTARDQALALKLFPLVTDPAARQRVASAAVVSAMRTSPVLALDWILGAFQGPARGEFLAGFAQTSKPVADRLREEIDRHATLSPEEKKALGQSIQPAPAP